MSNAAGFSASQMLEGDALNANDTQSTDLTAGQLLRNARQAQSMNIDVLSNILKVPTYKIEALENDQHAVFPDAVFIRALACGICRVLKVEDAPVLALLPRSAVLSLEAKPLSRNMHFKPDGFAPRSTSWSSLSRFSLMGAFALVLAAGAVYWMPESQAPQNFLNESTNQVKHWWRQFTDSEIADPPSSTVVLSNPADFSSAAQTSSNKTPAVSAASTSNNTAISKTVATPLMSASTPTTESPSVQPGVVNFRVSAASWVEVVDAKKSVLLRRMLEPGETASVSGSVPMVVVVGRVDATQVWVRGETYELAAFSKNNVARFEVK